MRRLRWLLAALVLCAWALPLLAAGPARAAHLEHELEAEITGIDVPNGPFQYVFGVAVDGSAGPGAGSVYVAHLTEAEVGLNSFVSKFNRSGSYTGVQLRGGETPQGGFSFFNPEEFALALSGLAVDSSGGPANGDIYVADVAHDVVDRFDASGEFLCQITGAATPSPAECAGIAGSATPAGGFEPTAIAVDPSSGTLYVGDAQAKVIDEFSPAGTYLGRIADSQITSPLSLAADSTGALYVVTGTLFSGESLLKFDPSGSFEKTIPAQLPVAVAVDVATDHVYVSQGGEATPVLELDSAGNPVGALPEPGQPRVSLAVSRASGRIYAGTLRFATPSAAAVFSPETIVPDVSDQPASAVAETSATFSGEVDPDGGGDAISCRFEYGPPSAPFSQSAPCSPAAPISAPTAVTAQIEGLTPSTTYRWRLAAANAGLPPYSEGVDGHGEERLFSTKGPPTVDAQSVDSIERKEAVLHATVNPHGYATESGFEYVDEAHFQEAGFAGPATRSTPISPLGAGLDPLPLQQPISGLVPGTTYRYRAIAASPRGNAVGDTLSFTTLPVARIGRQWAYARFDSATVEADVDPIGIATSCRVEYVRQADYEASEYANAQTRPCLKEVGPSFEGGTARAALPNLGTDSKYHFRFVVANASGEVSGADTTFSTFGIDTFTVRAVDAEGNLVTQAGGHPYESITHYTFKHTLVPMGSGGLEGSLDAFIKDVVTEFPPGRTGGSTEAAPKCPGHLADEQRCPGSSQVGRITVEYLSSGEIETRTRALFSVVPPEGVGSRYASIDPYTTSDARVRSGSDYGTTAGASNITEEARIVGVTSVTWGVPADPRHDPQRRCAPGETPCKSDAPMVPIIRNPTSCTGPLTASAHVDTWERPGEFVTAQTEMPAMTGCDRLQFDPSVSWRPTTTVADSPTGVDVDIHSPQNEDPNAPGVPDLRNVVIAPSEGLILNASAADGLVGCSPEQIQLHSEAPDRCPGASKVGTVEINTSLLEKPLRGGIYIATPHANPFDSTFAIYLAVHDAETGVVVKLAGRIDTNPRNGDLTAGFADNPQLPVEDFKLHFFDGPRAMLRTPPVCGTQITQATLTPWSAPYSGPPAHRTDSYRLNAFPHGGRCVSRPADAPQEVELKAGTTAARAGARAPFTLRLSREDGTQQIAGLSIAPPAGLLGRLRGIDQCSDAAVAAAARRRGREERAAPSCPANSKVGEVSIAAGAGDAPLRIPGDVYLAGPYKGAPLSLAVVVPAVAGPYDLGVVVVRSGLDLQLESGRLSVHTDPIPTVVEGIALDVRSISVRLDRPGFTVNPTSCAAMATRVQVVSTLGASLSLSDPFQVQGCDRLGFGPKIGMRLFGKVNRGAHPRLRAQLTVPEGGANIAAVSVALPPSEFLDSTHIDGICTRAQFAAKACPPGSAYGHIRVWTSLLEAPLAGPVLMRSSHHRLPDLVADLDGQFRLAVGGELGIAGGGLQAKVAGIPDAAVSKIVLTMDGGSDGLLQNSVNLCANPRRASVRFQAQNGKVVVRHPLLRARCPG